MGNPAAAAAVRGAHPLQPDGRGRLHWDTCREVAPGEPLIVDAAKNGKCVQRVEIRHYANGRDGSNAAVGPRSLARSASGAASDAQVAYDASSIDAATEDKGIGRSIYVD